MIWLLTFAKSVSPRSWVIVGAVAVILAIGLAIYLAGRGDERDAQADRTAKTEARASTGRETAATERAVDTANLNLQRKATDDALATLPDAAPSDRRVLRHCLRLPDNGAGVPECQRLTGQAPAGR